jgi:Calcineurin-like phosphoesterase
MAAIKADIKSFASSLTSFAIDQDTEPYAVMLPLLDGMWALVFSVLWALTSLLLGQIARILSRRSPQRCCSPAPSSCPLVTLRFVALLCALIALSLLAIGLTLPMSFGMVPVWGFCLYSPVVFSLVWLLCLFPACSVRNLKYGGSAESGYSAIDSLDSSAPYDEDDFFGSAGDSFGGSTARSLNLDLGPTFVDGDESTLFDEPGRSSGVFRRTGIDHPQRDTCSELSPKRVLRRKFREVRARPVCFVVGLLLLAGGLVAGLWFATRDGCEEFEPTGFSTRLSRAWTETDPCKDSRKPCHVYFTLAPRLDSALIVNFQTGVGSQNSSAGDGPPPFAFWSLTPHAARRSSSLYNNSATGSCHKLAIDEIDRFVSAVVLSPLVEGQTYYVRVGLSRADADLSDEYVIRAVPRVNNTVGAGGFSFIAGGDIGITADAQDMMDVAARQEPRPHFALIGGDVAYANSIPACWPRWDQWFANWESGMVTPEKWSIPMSVAIGNHDAGGFGRTRSQIHFFLDYFAQQIGGPEKSLQPLETDARLTYHAHSSPDLLVIMLDSSQGSSASSQRKWMKDQEPGWLARNFSHRVACYHVPMYPASHTYDDPINKNLRDEWVSVFDDLELTAVFENHAHAYKRTFPLRAGKIAAATERGRVYVGDGRWGANPSAEKEISADGVWYLKEANKDLNVLHVVIDPSSGQAKIQALGKGGKDIDRVVVDALPTGGPVSVV